jgi:hypothetical protein
VQVATDNIALTGLNFFPVTRTVLLTVRTTKVTQVLCNIACSLFGYALRQWLTDCRSSRSTQTSRCCTMNTIKHNVVPLSIFELWVTLCFVDRASQYVSIMKPTLCNFYTIYWQLSASTCFDHYLFFLRRHWTKSTSIPIPTFFVKVRAIPLQALTGPEGSRRLRLPDFKTIDTWRW